MPAESAGVFEALGDPVRRHILELLGDGDQPAGAIAEAMRSAHGISQPAASQHLKVLRGAGLVSSRPEGRRRVYAVDPAGFATATAWLEHFANTFAQPLDALETELARGRRQRRTEGADPDAESTPPESGTGVGGTRIA
ncbi:MAG: ArsR/SmtB family transcription factor [Propionibacteriaceae bacterium]